MKVSVVKGGKRNTVEVTSSRGAWSRYEWVKDLGEEAGAVWR